MIGPIFALLTALSWAGSGIILKFLSARIDSLSINRIRLWVGSLMLLAFVVLSGRSADLIRTPLLPLVYVAISGVVAVAVGDTVYIKSLSFLDVSQAYPIAQSSFPVLTLLVALLILHEPFTWVTGVGAVLVVVGIYLIAAAGRKPEACSTSGKVSGKGVILAIIAAVAWTTGAATLKLGAADMDTFVAAAIRIGASAIALSCFLPSRTGEGRLQLKRHGVRNTLLAASGGIISYGVAAVCYVMAIQLIGAGRTVLLTGTAPLFLLPMSIFILKEKPTRCAIAGIFVCIAGIYLVTI